MWFKFFSRFSRFLNWTLFDCISWFSLILEFCYFDPVDVTEKDDKSFIVWARKGIGNDGYGLVSTFLLTEKEESVAGNFSTELREDLMFMISREGWAFRGYYFDSSKIYTFWMI